MKFYINKITATVALTLLLFTACNNEKGSNSENKDAKEEAKTEEAGHEEEPTTIATLTQEQIKAAGIKFGNLENKELTATIKANGTLRVPNNNRGNTTSLYGGVIKTLNVQIGDYVKKGQVIATISNPQFIQLQEEYLAVSNKITFADQEVQRQKELNAGNAGALKNLQNATAELNSLLTRKASLQQQIRLMGINPASVSNNSLKTTLVIKSSLKGVVSNVFAKIGSYVDVSAPVLEIVDNSSLHLDLQVFEKDLPLLKVGQTIHFTLTNNPVDEYDAKVFSIGSSFENESKTVSVHCDVTGNKRGLIDGMNVTGIVSLNNVTAPAVPTEAIASDNARDYVFVVTDKKPEEHHEEEGGEEHSHEDEKTAGNGISLEKIEVVRGVSNMGYTAVTFVQDVAKNAQVVTKGAFFVNAKLSNTGGHEH
ncbi:efflux RND transporter periplasmic adaptor subunit [Pedobacter endophyticus]|uniref:Efflux RND transporter periplasmic adaptor subunit n=1 Tax=Pedobacter endophyticus TaxID=2789740 RepID=A0A7S9Q033_9SPHI|nr:efflux RND transporter periplasmic adaptor subunit [Pedobacter endophyticus]QPH40973.1 efflux RND transporter periplasmic adaptor subunit [Pedobacter endophyticus]